MLGFHPEPFLFLANTLKRSLDMSKRFIVKAEHPRPHKRPTVKQEPSDGVMIIPPLTTERELVPHRQSANVKVVATLDIKATRMQVLGAWQSY